MADSIDCHQFPASVDIPNAGAQPISLLAGYVGGSHEASSHACGNISVNIDVDGTHPTADVLDIEQGDATPDTAPGWVSRHNALGGYPAILYCNRSTIHAVANAVAAAGLVVGKDYRWWISTLDGTTHVADMTGVTAVQAWGANFFPGRNIDVSVVYDDSWKAGSVSSPTQDANAVWWQTTVQRRDPDGSVWTNPALQEVGDIKTLLLGEKTPHGETNGMVSAILNALPDLINKAVADALANNAVKVQISVTGTAQGLPS